MGHIDLAAPVSHIWYFKGIPSPVWDLFLIFHQESLEKVLYFASYIVLDPVRYNILNISRFYQKKNTEKHYENYGNSFRVGMGAEAVKELLQSIDVEKEAEELKAELFEATGQKKAKIVKRLEVY